MAQGIENKVVMISSASSAPGEAAARHLAKEGAKLVLGARRVDRLQALAGEVEIGENAILATDLGRGRQELGRPCRRPAWPDRCSRQQRWSDDELPLALLKVEEWDRMIHVNLKGSSAGLHIWSDPRSVYAATKHALRVIFGGPTQEVEPYTSGPRSPRRVQLRRS